MIIKCLNICMLKLKTLNYPKILIIKLKENQIEREGVGGGGGGWDK